MRFLLDENLSPRIGAPLIDAGHDVLHVRDCGLAGATDVRVLAYGVKDDRVVVTADRADFGRELASSGEKHPSVLLLRQVADVARASDVARLILANLTTEVAGALEVGAFVVLSPTAVRIRFLPIR